MYCHKQFNGSYGCWKCLQASKVHQPVKDQCGHTFKTAILPARMHSQVLKDSRQASESGQEVNGIRHPVWLNYIPMYDTVRRMSVDYMHGVCLGVTKLMMKLWFSADTSGQEFNIKAFVKLVDKRITNLRPPLEISRIPRSIENHLTYWKAAEFRTFLLFYGSLCWEVFYPLFIYNISHYWHMQCLSY